MPKLIVFTGGGSAGHVVPNLAIIQALPPETWQVAYIGAQGIEKKLVHAANIPYYEISTGKLHRRLTLKNLLTPYKVLKGIYQAYRHLKKLRPQMVFSKGGFVAFPVVFSAWLQKIPVICHESDLTPGLANKLSLPFAKKICVTFEESRQQSDPRKVIVTGTPLRSSLFQGQKARGLAIAKFQTDRPVILVYAGGSGSLKINRVLREALPELLQTFQVIHLCGQGNLAKEGAEGYFQLEYASAELPDLLAAADLVISRAGANSLYELIALHKPHLLIPLSRKVSRGDQIENAAYAKQRGLSLVLEEEALSANTLVSAISQLFTERAGYHTALENYPLPHSLKIIQELINHESL